MINEVINNENLRKAYKKVVANKGAAGVDGKSVSELLPLLQENQVAYLFAIRKGKYQVSPILGVEIPKSKDKTRLLGIPTVVDRLFQQAIQQVLQPIFERDFQENSFGFRPKRNAHQALAKANEFINQGFHDIVDIDLKSFFDNVEHTILLDLIYKKIKCPLLMKWIRKFIRAPIQIKGKLVKRRKGVPQGSPLSPLLSNILLNELDKELEKRGLRYVRYADDFSIYVKSKQAAKRVGNGIYLFLKKKLKLPINKEKSGIRRPRSFTMLGFAFTSIYKKGTKGKYQAVVAKSSWKKFKYELKQITRKTNPVSFEERIKHLNLCIRGWVNYFKPASIFVKLKKLDEWVRNRLRYCIWHHWKKPERKRKNLIRLGVRQGMAYAWSRTNMGGWAVAQSSILGTTITKVRLAQKGYIEMATYYKK
ncbi:group II intron reverse transcriptase/maturase [Aureivirga sp. CE67]|uniref:group II intron reverse transcriptase/maturase n=1 Tax=Aureivirga sp. CE67 TaxID=1788983 RepID=UPI0018CA948D|nr:group II intron reverse transcriptase/maturase [Aureivirga sp. CE67]